MNESKVSRLQGPASKDAMVQCQPVLHALIVRAGQGLRGFVLVSTKALLELADLS